MFTPRIKVRQFLTSFRCFFSYQLTRKLVSLILILNLLSATTFAAADGQGLLVSAGEMGQDIRYAWKTSNSLAFFSTDIIGTVVSKVTGKRKQPDIQRLVILPTGENNTLTVSQGETLNFTAIGLTNNQPVSGVPVEWSYTVVGRESSPRPFKNGTFQARTPGKYVIIASVGNVQAFVTLIVNPNFAAVIQRLLQKPEEQRTDKEKIAVGEFIKRATITTREVSSKKVYDLAEEQRLNELEKQRLEEVRVKQQEFLKNRPQLPTQPSANQTPRQGGPSPENLDEIDQSISPTEDKVSETEQFIPEPVPYRPPDDHGWDGGNWSAAIQPNNYVGSVPGTAPDRGATNGDYQFAAPVVSLPGRGINVNLALYYNSRLWSKAGAKMIYDADKGSPAPGWNLGFGKLARTGANGCMLIQPDGSRQSHSGSNTTSTYGSYYNHSYTGYTTDGSFTNYSCAYQSGPYGASLSGQATLANGSKIIYGSPSPSRDQVYPTKIIDPQGNYITITYVGNQGPNIQTITDTMGRVITFNYDGSNRLINITGPGYNGATRTYIQLHYFQPTLSYAFAGGYTTDTATNTPYLIDAIYYPDTNTGYWFGDGNSYSSYGMIAKVISQRGMSWSGSPGTQGTVTQGTANRTETYNFDMTANSSLTDAPMYTTYTEDWQNNDTGSPAVTSYNVSYSTGIQEIMITRPDGVRNKQTSVVNPGVYDDGNFVQNEIIQPSGVGSAVLSKSKTYLASGAWGTSRPTKIESTDELNQTTTTEFTYGANYNQVTEVLEKNYSNSLYRKTVNTYENSSNYTNRHIFNLVKSTEVLDSSSTRLSKVEYDYDTQTLTNTPSVIMHENSHNPYTSETMDGPYCNFPVFNYWRCDQDGGVAYDPDIGWIDCYIVDCAGYEQISVYDTTNAYRGNLTKVRTYTNAGALSGAIEYDYTYDITGNQRTASADCCQQITTTYSTTTQYALPDSITKGHPSNATYQISASATYDYNTSVTRTSTDFNGRTSTYNYDAVTRPTSTILPTGAGYYTYYNDANNFIEKRVFDASSVGQNHAVIYFNGRGQARVVDTYAKLVSGDYWNSSNWTRQHTQFDVMGRKVWANVPHLNSASSPGYTTYQYDHLSRVTQVTAPDGSTSKSFYNEVSRPSGASGTAGNTVRSQDGWGRERWARTDDFGRVVEVMEPNPTGNGGFGGSGHLQTTYSYDPLNQLNVVTQGSQTRAFAYDSLGRVVLQKLAEQTATINNSGTYVGSGGGGALWSEAFVYDNRSNLIQRTDARGVKTNYSYINGGSLDPLNRLQGVSYDKSTADTTYTIHTSSPFTISYMATGDKTRISQVASWWTTETNAYDAEGRVSDYTIEFPSSTSQPLTTSYLYDSTNRLTEARYPAQYGLSGNPRKVINYDYDETSRLSQLSVDSGVQLSNLSYNPMHQVTQLTVGASTANPVTENYSYDSVTGLLTGQTAVRTSTSTTLINLEYDYQRGNSNGSINAKTGNLTRIKDNLNHNKDRIYEFDALGRLRTAKGGLAAGATSVTSNWTMDYDYDRYGNRTGVTPTGTVFDGSTSTSVPTDGINGLTYDASSNRINTSGFTYDLAGNMVRGQNVSGVWQRYEYDEGGRLVATKDDAGNDLLGNGYTSSNKRLVTNEAGIALTWYVWGGSSVIAEYTSGGWGSTPLTWSKSYVHAGSRLLSTYKNDGSGGQTLEYHHSDRLGTKTVTNPTAATSFEQNTLPFGTGLNAETTGTTNQRFTSYDRSANTGLDYAVNRSYSSGQGRFTQVDPIGMEAASIGNPQSLNMYGYVQNNPIDYLDPSGLNKEAPDSRGRRGMLYTMWYGNNQDGWSFVRSWFEPYPDESGSDEGGGGAGTASPQNSQCRNFVNGLVSLAFNYYFSIISSVFGTNRTGLGREFLARGYASMNAKNEGVSTAGFRNELIANEQGADIYRHLYGHIGATLIGNDFIIPGGSWGRSIARKFFGDSMGPINVDDTGTMVTDRELRADEVQRDQGRQESITEVLNDQVGRRIGAQLRDFMNQNTHTSQDWTNLRQSLFSELCSN